jgi:hypothetical protein
MITDEIKIAIKKRAETDDEWTFGIEQCWKDEIEILSRNIQETISFLENKCSSDEFVWLSEVFDDVAEKTQSREFVNTLYKVAKKYPEETKKYHILKCIAYAEGALEE